MVGPCLGPCGRTRDHKAKFALRVEGGRVVAEYGGRVEGGRVEIGRVEGGRVEGGRMA